MPPLDANWITSHGKGKLPRRAFNQIKAMINERSALNIIGKGTTNYMNYNGDYINKYRIIRSAGDYSITGRYPACRQTQNLMPAFIDNRINDYSGYDEFTYWSEQSLLDYLGYPEFPFPDDRLKVANINWQLINILDNLKWSNHFADYESTQDIININITGYRKRVTASSWEDALSLFNTSQYINSGQQNNIFRTQTSRLLSHSTSYYPWGEYEIIRQYVEVTVTNNYDFDILIDFYVIFTHDDLGSVNDYINPDFPDAIQNKLYKYLADFPVQAHSSNTFSTFVSDVCTLNNPYPYAYKGYVSHEYISQILEYLMVVKYYDGFEYKLEGI